MHWTRLSQGSWTCHSAVMNVCHWTTFAFFHTEPNISHWSNATTVCIVETTSVPELIIIAMCRGNNTWEHCFGFLRSSGLYLLTDCNSHCTTTLTASLLTLPTPTPLTLTVICLCYCLHWQLRRGSPPPFPSWYFSYATARQDGGTTMPPRESQQHRDRISQRNKET